MTDEERVKLEEIRAVAKLASALTDHAYYTLQYYREVDKVPGNDWMQDKLVEFLELIHLAGKKLKHK